MSDPNEVLAEATEGVDEMDLGLRLCIGCCGVIWSGCICYWLSDCMCG